MRGYNHVYMRYTTVERMAAWQKAKLASWQYWKLFQEYWKKYELDILNSASDSDDVPESNILWRWTSGEKVFLEIF